MKGCNRCKMAAEKMDRMGFEYTETKFDDPPHDWRRNGICDAMAWAALQGGNHTPVPVIAIDGEHFNYSGGMKRLKAMRNN